MAAGSTMHAWATHSGKLSAGEIQSLYANRPEVVDGPMVPSSRWMGCLKQEQVLMAVTGS